MKATQDTRDGSLLLAGLDGANPLAFLAALGTLRTLTLAWPDREVKMAWVAHASSWRPVIHADEPFTGDACIAALQDRLARMDGHLALSLADNLNVEPQEFREFAQRCVQMAEESSDVDRRIAVDFAASFANDVTVNQQGKIQDTALRTMSGAGHQHFLANMRSIIKKTTREQLDKTIFRPWAYDDPSANQTLRWDPADDSRYALQWRDPSGDPARRKSGSMLGANRLAIEGLPLMCCAPSGTVLRTVGFSGRSSRNTFWTWPIWSCRVSLDVCRSLIAMPTLLNGEVDETAKLRDMGIVAAFRSQRITVGKFRNFAPATAVF